MFGKFTVIKKCKTTNARVSEFVLQKNTLHTPIFMPVATYGAMRGVSVDSMPEEIILSNTYHLRNLGKNIKDFMSWNKSMLTDSGGFQIQSLPNVEVTDEGVVFDNKLFTPEDSMDIQLGLGADIMMQLDDVVNPNEPREKHVKAISRSIDWLDRAIIHIGNKHRNKRGIGEDSTNISDNTSDLQNVVNDNADSKKKAKIIPSIANFQKIENMNQTLFPIIQGGLIDELRKKSIDDILLRNPIGLAIGGLSGGEDKMDFCNTVLFCCKHLPDHLPRYLMGVGYPEDVVVCSALGTDMSDCVYPTRTARFGRGFTDDGDVMIDNKVVNDLTPISSDCQCSTCSKYSKAFLATIKGTPNFCMLMSHHNLHYMRSLTSRIRENILNDSYPEFIKAYMTKRYKGSVPEWILKALEKVNVRF